MTPDRPSLLRLPAAAGLLALALAALPPAALYALTHLAPAVAALAVLTVLVVARGRPRTE